MPATFNLELAPGQNVALDTTISSDELDMARMEDGTTVDGQFWGKLNIVHQGDTHTMEFSGTRIVNAEEVPPDLLVDARVISKLAVVSKPSTAKCHLNILAPTSQYCDITLQPSQLWKLGLTWPTAEPLEDNKVKYFLRVHPGGAIEHFETQINATSLYYEAMCVMLMRFTMITNNDYCQTRSCFRRTRRIYQSSKRLCDVLPRFHPSSHTSTRSARHVSACTYQLHQVCLLLTILFLAY